MAEDAEHQNERYKHDGSKPTTWKPKPKLQPKNPYPLLNSFESFRFNDEQFLVSV